MSSKEFYQKQIDSLTFMLNRLEKNGEEALHEIDRPKGLEWNKNKLKEDIGFFKEKLKNAKD